MGLRLLMTILALSLAIPQPLHSRAVRIALIPFSFHGEKDLSRLRDPLKNMLSKGLKQYGFQPVPALDELGETSEYPARKMSDDMARIAGSDK